MAQEAQEVEVEAFLAHVAQEVEDCLAHVAQEVEAFLAQPAIDTTEEGFICYDSCCLIAFRVLEQTFVSK